MLDFTSDFGQRALKRLQAEPFIWLTTTSKDGTPQPRPVWFAWDDGRIYIITGETGAKLRHIARTPRVSVHFNHNQQGGDVVVLLGVARNLGLGGMPDNGRIALLGKYGMRIMKISGQDPDTFFAHRVGIEITPDRLRGF